MYRKVSTAIFVVLVAQVELPDGLFSAIHAHSYRIRDFVKTRESIWTYNTTKRKDVRCRYDLMRFIDSGFIAFNRTMLRNRQRISLELLGEFSSRHLARMHIFHGPHQLSTETLVYKAPDSSCGVIVVRSLIRDSAYVDLRVRNTFIRGGPAHDCRREFSGITQWGKVIYSPNCSMELRKALE
uniref:Putative group i salivary lipocalin n=1 Tax=Rhipicephalus pulchellus TaxID=72859 RepID=L7LR27_RHIPC